MKKKQERGEEHKADMRARGQILRAKMLGFRELLLLLIEQGVVVPSIERRFRVIDGMTPETLREVQTDNAILHEARQVGYFKERPGEHLGSEGLELIKAETSKKPGGQHGKDTHDQAGILDGQQDRHAV